MIEGALLELPRGWVWTKLGDICQVSGGKRLPKGHTYSETQTNCPYIRVTDFEKMTINDRDIKFLNPDTQKLINRYTISKEDVYISIAGSIGKVGLIPDKLNGANLTENAAKITNLIAIEKKFLCNALNYIHSQQQIKTLTSSTSQPKLALFRIKYSYYSAY
jgi:type I restriction enzyme S subunit